MQNVDQHPKSGIYRVRVTYPAHLRTVLKAVGVNKSLGTRDAVMARKLAISVLASIQRLINDAEAIHAPQTTGRTACVTLTLADGI
jgi:hypothetical protein